MPQKSDSILKTAFITLLLLAGCVLVVFIAFLSNTIAAGSLSKPESAKPVQIMDRFDSWIADTLLQTEEILHNVPKSFWLREDAAKGPVPDPRCYGATTNPQDLLPILKDAEELLDGQQTLFSTDVVLKPGSEITWYLDETILAITWKQVIDNYVYTISEIKVSHPSQFRRHLAGGAYDSGELYTVRTMSEQVNAIVGTSADFYRGREYGTKVYQGKVRSVSLAHACDVCYIDRNGDLIFSYRGEMTDHEEIQKFVDENEINFSVSFGPILVDNGSCCVPAHYALGEINRKYSRAALCQMGPLHYLSVVANTENEYFSVPTIYDFAENLRDFGCEKAYALDGGNTGNIVMNNKLINIPALGHERLVSDILYFCTAVPNGE